MKIAASFCLVVAFAAAQSLTIEKLIDIKHPSDPIWSPDGRQVVFIWDRAGVSNLYVADASSTDAAPLALTHFSEGSVAGAFWSKDNKTIYFPHQGDLWQVPGSGGEARAVWTTPSSETNIVMAPDGASVAFVRAPESGRRGGSDLWVRSLAGGEERRLASSEYGLGGVAWSPDGLRLSYSAGARTIRHDEAPEYSGAKIIYTTTERTPGELCVISAQGGQPVVAQDAGRLRRREDGSDATHLVFERQSADFKKRTIFVADAVQR